MPAEQSQIVELAFPIGGLNVTSSLAQQPELTTTEALNVRPFDVDSDRQRPARRAGLARYVPDRLNTAPVQDIGAVFVSLDQVLGTGNVLTAVNASGGVARIYENGILTTSVKYESSKLPSLHSIGCSDVDNNFYFASSDNTSVEIRKVGTDFMEKWAITLPIGDQVDLFGMDVFDHVVYLAMYPGPGSSFDRPGIYRFDDADGARLDHHAWMNEDSGLGKITSAGISYQCLATAAGRIAFACDVGGNLVLQLIDISDRMVIHNVPLQTPLVSHACRVVSDDGGNMYVLTNVDGSAVNQLFRVVPSGNVAYIVTSTNNLARDIDYDSLNYLLGIAGQDVFGVMGTSFQTRTAVDGVIWQNAAPAGIASYVAVAAGSNGGWRLRAPPGPVDLVKTADNLSVLWTTSTGAAATTQRLWIASSGSTVPPEEDSMSATRLVRLYAVCRGDLFRLDSGRAIHVASKIAHPDVPVVFSSVFDGQVYFTDGLGIRFYNPYQNIIGTLTATAGQVPTDINSRYPRLIASWNNRLFLAGLVSDPHNWFASAIDNAQDWDYGATPAPNIAYAGTFFGEVPDVVNAIMPFTHDTLVFFCDHSIFVFNGDPGVGGEIDLVSDVIGGAFGRPFCRDDEGTAYFVGNNGCLYRMIQGGRVERLSSAIDDALLRDIDLNNHLVRLLYDAVNKGVHLFYTRLDRPGGEAFYWHRASGRTFPTGSFWKDAFGNLDFYPFSVFLFDGDRPGDRAGLIGCRDGYVRYFADRQHADDGFPIASSVSIGPLRDQQNFRLRIKDFQATLAESSGPLSYAFRAGPSIEQAMNAPRSMSGQLSPGRSRSQAVRIGGNVFFVDLFSDAVGPAWSWEDAWIMLERLGFPSHRIW